MKLKIVYEVLTEIIRLNAIKNMKEKTVNIVVDVDKDFHGFLIDGSNLDGKDDEDVEGEDCKPW